MLELGKVLRAIRGAGIVVGIVSVLDEVFFKCYDIRDGVVFEADGKFAFGQRDARGDFARSVQG